MDTLKYVYNIKKWVWAIPLIALAILFVCLCSPTATAKADPTYTLNLSGFSGEYGNFAFNDGQIGEYDGKSCVILHGNFDSSNSFNICSFSEEYTYYIVVRNLHATRSGQTIKFMDDNGKIIAPPVKNLYGQYVSYKLEPFYKENEGDNDSFLIFAKGSDIPADIYFTAFSGASDSAGTFQVRPKVVEVKLNQEAIAANIGSDSNETDIYIDREYFSNSLPIEFNKDQSASLAFDDHRLDCSNIVINGNKPIDGVGSYPVDVKGSKITVLDASDTDVSEFYDIRCDQNITIRVSPLHVIPEPYSKIEYYTNPTFQRDAQGNIISCVFDIDFNPTLKPGLTVSFHGELQYTDEDIDPTGNLKVTYDDESQKPYHLYYKMSLIAVNDVSSDDALDNIAMDYDYDDLEDRANYKMSIVKRPITLYLEGHASEDYDPEVSVGINYDGFSNPYGEAYEQQTMRNVTIQDIPVTITFEIAGFEDIKNAGQTKELLDGRLILNVGVYDVVNAKIGEDSRYEIIKVDQNMVYTIFPKEISLAEFYQDGKVNTDLIVSNESYLIATLEYDVTRSGVWTTTLSVTDTFDVLESVPEILTVAFDLGEGRPQTYVATSATSENYIVTDHDKLSAKINKALLTAIYDQTHEYDGNSISYAIVGQQQDLDLSYTVTFSEGKKYDGAKATTEPPVHVGKDGNYVIRFTLAEDSEYSFEGDKNYFDGAFKLTPRNLRLEITYKIKEKYFGEELKMSNVASFEVFYDPDNNGSGTEAGFLEGDNYGELLFQKDWDKKSALPGEYYLAYNFSSTDYSVNSKIKYFYDGAQTTSAFIVKKLTVEKFKKLNAFSISSSNVIIEADSLTLPSVELYGVTLTNVVLAYKYDNDENYTTSNSLTADGLIEGATYSLKYVLKKGNNLVDNSENIEGSPKDIITKLFAPTISQYAPATTSEAIAIEILNYSPDNDYSYKMDNDDAIQIDNADVKHIVITETVYDEDEDEEYDEDVEPEVVVLEEHWVYFITGLDADEQYKLKFIRNTQYTKSASPTLTAYTASKALPIAKDALSVTSSSITIALDEELISDDQILAYEYVKGQSGHATLGSISTDAADLSVYFADTNAIVKGEGSAILDLESNTVYYIKVYLAGDASNNYVNSDVVYFEVHTDRVKTTPEKIEEFITKASKYLLVGSIGVFAILFIIMLIKFVSIKKKYDKKYIKKYRRV